MNTVTYFIGNQPKIVRQVWSLEQNLSQIRSNVVKKNKETGILMFFFFSIFCTRCSFISKTKSTTYFVEITNQQNKKYLSEGRNPLACLTPGLLASCKLRNFPREFTEKSFAVFDQSSCAIYLTWYSPLLFFWEFYSIIPFMVWL